MSGCNHTEAKSKYCPDCGLDLQTASIKDLDAGVCKGYLIGQRADASAFRNVGSELMPDLGTGFVRRKDISLWPHAQTGKAVTVRRFIAELVECKVTDPVAVETGLYGHKVEDIPWLQKVLVGELWYSPEQHWVGTIGEVLHWMPEGITQVMLVRDKRDTHKMHKATIHTVPKWFDDMERVAVHKKAMAEYDRLLSMCPV